MMERLIDTLLRLDAHGRRAERAILSMGLLSLGVAVVGTALSLI